MIRLTLTFRQNVGILRASRNEALTDALTGLGNRRALTRELDDALAAVRPEHPLVLALFDLDGFKHYNDTFGHPAGDVLLARLGGKLRAFFGNRAHVFRMGGDEFCALFEQCGTDLREVLDGASLALSEQGDGFWIGCSYGSVTLPRDATQASEALRIADQRMYVHKHAGRMSAGRQVKEALTAALAARDPRLEADARALADVAEAAARTLGLNRDERETVRLAAELHQVGRLVATAPADVALASERIVAAAPALAGVAQLLRALPDADAPLGAQIVAVATYGAGAGADPAVVEAVAAARPSLV
jgi:diguanylate cyclase (GGDEF)-like protein